MVYLITGGAGFIGSSLVRYLITNTNDTVINIDKLTYASNLDSLSDIDNNKNYFFEKVDICDKDSLARIYTRYQPDAVIHLAAESHVDRSIDSPDNFISTNILGTYNLLEISRMYWLKLNEDKKKDFRFLHVSTDEVYGDLDSSSELFNEESSYNPSSPYSASKASSNFLVSSWGRTYGLPVLITNASNNYGPYQFPEKMIPVVITNAINGMPIPIYGNGKQIRDWIYVEDHVRALLHVIKYGEVFEAYNIGSRNILTNIDLVKKICSLLETINPNKPAGISAYEDLITKVSDRPGHDLKYAINPAKIENLGWQSLEKFDDGLSNTVKWYLENLSWVDKIKNNES